jgi:hypothetical protein
MKKKMAYKKPLKVRGGFAVPGGPSKPRMPKGRVVSTRKRPSNSLVGAAGRILARYAKDKAVDMASGFIADTINKSYIKVKGVDFRAYDLKSQASAVDGDNTTVASTYSYPPVYSGLAPTVFKTHKSHIKIGTPGLSPWVFSKSDPVDEIVQIDTQKEVKFQPPSPNPVAATYNAALEDRNSLNPEWGFNTKLIHFMRCDEIPNVRRFATDMSWPSTFSAGGFLGSNDAEAKYRLKVSKSTAVHRFTNTASFTDSYIRVTLFTLQDRPYANHSQWLMDECFNVGANDTYFRFPANNVLLGTQGSVGVSPAPSRYSGHILVDPTVTFNKIPYLRERATIISQVSKTLGPNDIWELKIEAFYKSGLDLQALHALWIDGNTSSATAGTSGQIPISYCMMVECWGKQVEGTIFNGNISGSNRSSVMGTAPGCFTRESRVTFTTHQDDVSRQALASADYEPAKLLAEGASLRYGVNVKKRRISVNPTERRFFALPSQIGATGDAGKILSIRTQVGDSNVIYSNVESAQNP